MAEARCERDIKYSCVKPDIGRISAGYRPVIGIFLWGRGRDPIGWPLPQCLLLCYLMHPKFLLAKNHVWGTCWKRVENLSKACSPTRRDVFYESKRAASRAEGPQAQGSRPAAKHSLSLPPPEGATHGDPGGARRREAASATQHRKGKVHPVRDYPFPSLPRPSLLPLARPQSFLYTV